MHTVGILVIEDTLNLGTIVIVGHPRYCYNCQYDGHFGHRGH